MANRKTAKKHALRRLKSRQGIKDVQTVVDLAAEVLENGIQFKKLPEDDEYALAYANKSNTWKRRAYLYKDFIYIFNDDKILVTAYKARKELLK